MQEIPTGQKRRAGGDSLTRLPKLKDSTLLCLRTGIVYRRRPYKNKGYLFVLLFLIYLIMFFSLFAPLVLFAREVVADILFRVFSQW